MIHPKWIALINYCDDNPNCTIKKLEIQDGLPVFMIREEVIFNETMAEIKLKI